MILFVALLPAGWLHGAVATCPEPVKELAKALAFQWLAEGGVESR